MLLQTSTRHPDLNPELRRHCSDKGRQELQTRVWRGIVRAAWDANLPKRMYEQRLTLYTMILVYSRSDGLTDAQWQIMAP